MSRSIAIPVVCLMTTAFFLPLAGLGSASGDGRALQANHVVLAEIFTETWCKFCPPADNAFNDIVGDANLFPKRVVILEWQGDDARFASPDSKPRASYYGVSGFPTAVFDGVVTEVGGGSSQNDTAITNKYKNDINARPAKTVVDVGITGNIVGNTGYANVTVTMLDTTNLQNLKVRIVLEEDVKVTELQTQSGNTVTYRYTVRSVVSTQAVNLKAGEAQDFNVNFNINPAWKVADLGIVAFVQSDTTKEVLQASYDQFGKNSPVRVKTGASLADLSFSEDSPYTQISLAGLFEDPESDTIYYGGKTDGGNINITIDQTTGGVTLVPKKDWSGTDNLTFWGRDKYHATGGQVKAKATVLPVNDPPVRKTHMTDIRLLEEEVKSGADLDSVFTDVDSTGLTYTASGYSHVSVAIEQTTHVVTYTAPLGWYGKEVLTFTCTDDGGLTAIDIVNVTVQDVNHAPAVKTALKDIAMKEDEANTAIKLSTVFSDIDNDPLSYTFTGNQFIEVGVGEDSSVSLRPAANWSGTETIVFTASDGGYSVSDDTVVTVSPVNDAPYLRSPLGNADFTETDTGEPATYTTTKALKDVFTDIDSAASQLKYTASGGTSIQATVNGDLTVTYQSKGYWSGSEVITVTVSDGEFSVSDRVTVTVGHVNHPPVLKVTPDAATVKAVKGDEVTFTVTATDPDAGDTLTYKWVLDGKEMKGFDTSMALKTATLSVGSHKLTVTVADNYPSLPGVAEKTWTVSISAPPNRLPVVKITSPTETTSLKEGSAVALTAEASDPDGDTLTVTWYVDGSKVGTGNPLNITTLTAGSHTIKVTAGDGKGESSAQVTVTVLKPPAKPGGTTGKSPGFEGVALLGALMVAVGLLRRLRR